MTNSLTMIIPTETEILQPNTNEAREHGNNETPNNNNTNNNNAMLTRGTNYYHNNARISKTQQQQQQQQQLSSTSLAPQANLPFVGLVYVQDTLPNKVNTDKRDEILLGTVVLVDSRPNNALQLRQLICQQAVFTMDKRYIFLTNIGSPISVSQEVAIELKHLIDKQNIIKFTKDHSTIRCSVIGQYLNGHDQLIGYVLVSYDLNLRALRTRVDEVIRDSSATFDKYSTNYTFVHSFHYTIGRHNEGDILLIDIIRNHAIFIKFEMPLENLICNSNLTINDRPRNVKYSSVDDLAGGGGGGGHDDCIDGTSSKEKSAIRKRVTRSISRRKTVKHKQSMRAVAQQCDIMISYARQEAAEHALQLKERLGKSGYVVYLDVHEIEMGSDWQDSLNDAVRNCSYFIPLITPMYGKTQWTNREVKLADVLRKPIIPINFLDFWPPECLAIQFATTQYISWRPKPPETADASESKVWDAQSLELVTKGINERIKSLKDKEKKKEKEREASRDQHNNRQPRKLIVISSHPEQRDITAKIKDMLSPEYEVWCSCDDVSVKEEKLTKRSVPADSNQLTPIMEGANQFYAPLTPEVQDYARRIAESSKQRPKSVPNNEISTYEVRKNELSRTVTYNGGETYCSISPEKKEELLNFQAKLDASSLVIIMASSQYYNSRTSGKQVYYCGQRKKNILVNCDKSEQPLWFSKQISSEFPLNYQSPKFKDDLIQKIHTELDPDCKVMDTKKMKLKALVENLKKNIFNMETCVYIIGSTNLTGMNRNIEICHEIGKELAKVSNLQLVTNGFYGVADLVALRFKEEREKEGKDWNKSIIHILPVKDDHSYRDKARQNHDNLFDKIDYGQTLLMGDSVEERDKAVASILDICFLIGGDEDVIKVIDEFIWNDRFVVPIKSTGGAAGGEFEMINQKIFTCPNSVKTEDWSVLAKMEATPHEVAKAASRIMCDLKKAQYEHQFGDNQVIAKKSFIEKPQKRRMATRKKLNKLKLNSAAKSALMVDSPPHDGYPGEPNSPEKVLPCYPKNETCAIVGASTGTASRVRNFFRVYKYKVN